MWLCCGRWCLVVESAWSKKCTRVMGLSAPAVKLIATWHPGISISSQKLKPDLPGLFDVRTGYSLSKVVDVQMVACTVCKLCVQAAAYLLHNDVFGSQLDVSAHSAGCKNVCCSRRLPAAQDSLRCVPS